MPNVGNKEFKYDKEGMKAAREYAAKTNKEIQYKASGGNVAKYYNKGGRVAGCGPAQNKTS